MPPNIQNHDCLEMPWVEEVFPEDYRYCLNIETEEIAYGSDIETDSENDDDYI